MKNKSGNDGARDRFVEGLLSSIENLSDEEVRQELVNDGVDVKDIGIRYRERLQAELRNETDPKKRTILLTVIKSFTADIKNNEPHFEAPKTRLRDLITGIIAPFETQAAFRSSVDSSLSDNDRQIIQEIDNEIQQRKNQ